MSENIDIKKWWAENPMTYGDIHGKTKYANESYDIGTPDFLHKVDQQFYKWNMPLHGDRPFEKIFPYDKYSDSAKVLEIGCGMGTMAMNSALAGACVTAVDLNPTSIEQTKKRFEFSGLEADIRIEDANCLSFDDDSFDYVYSWGVLHHSPNLGKSISEMFRVCRPGGGFGIMLYNRNSLWHRYMTEYIEGFLHRENEFLDPLQLASRYGDGYREEGNPHTWPVTKKEINSMLSEYSGDVDTDILGTELDGLFDMMLPGIGMILPVFIKKSWARRFGWSLWSYGHKE